MVEKTLPASPVIELIGVDKTFDNGTTAVRALNLSLRRGEFTCLVGPSGCGKSTALRIVAGLGKVSAGEVRWGQSDAIGSAGSHEIGFVFQEPTLLPWSRVWDNVYLPLRLNGLARKDASDRVELALSMVSLTEFAHVYPRELSGGMKMRVSIARALVTRPELLLMDEPFGALDEMTRFSLNDQLLQLWQQNRWTIAFVTHSVYEAVYLSERVVVMSARPGRVVEEIAVDAAYPRDESFRRSNVYHDTCSRVSHALAEAAGAHSI